MSGEGSVFSKMTFKVESLENTIEEAHQEISNKHSVLKELKERHLHLKEILQMKTKDLQDRKEKNMLIMEELKLEEFRIKETEEEYQTELELTEASRNEVKEIQEQLQLEKENQIENLKLYEKKMAVLSQSFREGPQHYDRKNMTQKIKNLELISAGLKKEIADNEKKLNGFINKFQDVSIKGESFCKNSSYLLKLLEEDLENNVCKEISILKKAEESLDKLISEQGKRDFINSKGIEE